MARQKRLCEVPNCGRARFGHGFCNAHYKRWRKSGDPGSAELRAPRGVCAVADCVRPHRARGLCDSHYKRWQTTGETPTTVIRPMAFRRVTGPCQRPGCGSRNTGSGYCSRHYSRMRALISYGLSGWDDFDRLWSEHKGRCAICRTVLDPESRQTHVDHDHETGAVRGILCHGCNSGLGQFQDDPERLRAAVKYITGSRR